MKRNYFCPQCDAHLNPNIKIILAVVRGPERGLALFSPQPGNYRVILAHGFSIAKGDLLDFHCPVCHASLRSPVSPQLARLVLRANRNSENFVDFSRTFGEEATFVISDEQVTPYGEHAEEYDGLNFFGE